MVRHVVMFKFKDETPVEQRTAFINSIYQLATDIDVIRALEIGQNFADSPRAFDFVLMVDFDDEDGLHIYAEHPKHQPVIEMAGQVCSATHVVDYEIAQG